MIEPSIHEKTQNIRAGILADRITRAAQWALFVGIVCGLVLPFAWAALRANGAASALVVLGLCLALCWHVKPSGRSLASQCREIEARFKAHD